jgi:hypothetical protein
MKMIVGFIIFCCCLQLSAIDVSNSITPIDFFARALIEETDDNVSVIGYLKPESYKYRDTLIVDLHKDSKSRGDYNVYADDNWGAGRYASIGALSAGAGVATYVGTMAAISAFGTASTGVAISTLSGVAASNASLALLGGGSLAVGGGGVAVGSAVLTGGIGVVVIGVGTGAVYLWRARDRAKEIERLSQKADKLSDPDLLYKIIKNDQKFSNMYF